jgi:adenylate cyclase
MSEAELDHRLAAIFSADVVGWTRLLADDEPAAIRALREAREQIGKAVARHRGRVVDSPGDNLLAEFSSALDAVRCSVEVQRARGPAAGGSPDAVPHRLHLGDIAVEG